MATVLPAADVQVIAHLLQLARLLQRKLVGGGRFDIAADIAQGFAVTPLEDFCMLISVSSLLLVPICCSTPANCTSSCVNWLGSVALLGS